MNPLKGQTGYDLISKLESYIVKQELNKADSIFSILENKPDLLNGNDSLKSTYHYFKGVKHYYKAEYTLASHHYEQALSFPIAQKHKGYKGRLLNNIGIIYDITGFYDKSLEANFKSLELSKKSDNQISIAVTKINIGLIKIKTKEYEDAKKFLDEAYEYLSKANDSINLALVLQNQAALLKKTGFYQEAVDKYFIVLDYLENLKADLRLIQCVSDLNHHFLTYKKYEESRDLLKKYKTKVEALGNEYATALFDLAEASFFIRSSPNDDNIEKNLKEIIETFDAFETDNLFYDTHNELFVYYSYINNTSAFENQLQVLQSIRDSFDLKERKQALAELNVIHNLAEKEQEIENKKVLLDIKTQKNRNLQILLLIISGLLTVIIAFYKRTNKLLDYLFKKNIESVHRYNQKASLKKNLEDQETKKFEELFAQILLTLKKPEVIKDSNLNIKYFANKLATNEKYISQAISLNSGLNFNRFISGFKIDMAKSLLIDSSSESKSIEVISEELGYINPSTFYRQFKDETGFSPGQFRKMNAYKQKERKRELENQF